MIAPSTTREAKRDWMRQRRADLRRANGPKRGFWRSGIQDVGVGSQPFVVWNRGFVYYFSSTWSGALEYCRRNGLSTLSVE